MDMKNKVALVAVILVSFVFVHFSLALGLPQCGRPENTIHEDPFLGKPFVIYPFDAGDSAQYHATVVRYCGPGAGSVALAGSRDSVKADSSVVESDSAALKDKPAARRRRMSVRRPSCISTDSMTISSSETLPKRWIPRAMPSMR